MGTARTIMITCLGAAATLAAPAAASAAVFNVNTTADAADANTFDSTCDSDLGTAGEQCTLRAALEQSNQLGGPNTVNVPAGTYTYSDSLGQWVVDTDTTIDGAGASSTILRQGIAGRIILVDTGDSLDLRDVTVRDGVLAGEGAGIYIGGALTLRDSRVIGNETVGANGGGIYAASSATRTEIIDSVIGTPADPNIAGSAGMATDAGKGGGIAVEGGNLVVRDTLIEANEANNENPGNANGGGIYLFTSGGGADAITDTVIRANQGNEGNGGGVLYSNVGTTTTRIEDVTISGNHADTCGGGLDIGGPDVDLLNVTVSGNTAANSGGGICSGGISVEHTTIAGNTSPDMSDGIRTVGTSTTTVTASILSQGTEDCSIDPGSSLVSGGFNLESGTNCGFTAGGDLQTASPSLGALVDNGGPTPTHALMPESMAIDRVTTGCPAPAADQRGAPRPQDGACDSGAYEFARCNGVIVNRVGTPGADQLAGTGAADGFLLLDGTNSATGGAGDDSACGGPAADTFDGGAGNDTLLAAGGRDKLMGGTGVDLLLGGAALDMLLGGAGADRGLGGGGGDRLKGQAGNDRLSGQGGRDRLLGGAGRDLLKGGAGRDLLRGGRGRDRLRGGPGRDSQRQ